MTDIFKTKVENPVAPERDSFGGAMPMTRPEPRPILQAPEGVAVMTAQTLADYRCDQWGRTDAMDVHNVKRPRYGYGV